MLGIDVPRADHRQLEKLPSNGSHRAERSIKSRGL